jgi:hypothetical protein
MVVTHYLSATPTKTSKVQLQIVDWHVPIFRLEAQKLIPAAESPDSPKHELQSNKVTQRLMERLCLASRLLMLRSSYYAQGLSQQLYKRTKLA